MPPKKVSVLNVVCSKFLYLSNGTKLGESVYTFQIPRVQIRYLVSQHLILIQAARLKVWLVLAGDGQMLINRHAVSYELFLMFNVCCCPFKYVSAFKVDFHQCFTRFYAFTHWVSIGRSGRIQVCAWSLTLIIFVLFWILKSCMIWQDI